jgi:Rrf2 family protein
MQITLGSKGNYAVRAILDLSHSYGRGRRKAREIAEAMHIPQNYLSIILSEFVLAGLLVATAGKEGGYELVRPPEDISLLEIVEIAEGPVKLEHCLLRGIPCGRNGYCAAHEAWGSAQRALTARLAETNFRELARQDEALRGSGAEAGSDGCHPPASVQ